MTFLGAIQLLLAGLLAWAASGKALDHHDMENALRVSGIPRALVGPLVVGVPVIEVTLAVVLVGASGSALEVGLASAAALFLLFTVWMISIRMRGRPIACGCFGGTKKEVSLASILRNLALATAAVAGVAIAGSTRPLMSPSTIWTYAGAITLVASVILVAAAVSIVPSLRMRSEPLDAVEPPRRESLVSA
nr:hypothetical protein [uncultured bacterium]